MTTFIQSSSRNPLMKNASCIRRIQNEIKQITTQAREYQDMFKIDVDNNDLFNWRATIYGPEDSLYDGYAFDLDIKLPENYPFSPISASFRTKILHVNVNSSGNICLDILKNNWSPSQNIQSVLLSIISLLGQPNETDPYNPELASIYEKNKPRYISLITKHCEDHAIKIRTKPTTKIMEELTDEKVSEELKELNFDTESEEEDVLHNILEKLECGNGDEVPERESENVF